MAEMTSPAEVQERTVVEGLPWLRQDRGDEESWKLDTPNVHVWVTKFGPRGFESWRGWRVGRGGTPLLDLNDGKAFGSRDRAMKAAVKVAKFAMLERIEDGVESVNRDVAALRDIVLPL